MSESQNIFDNNVFFEGYSELRARDDNYNILLEQPAMARLLPEIYGKKVLDLGCGCGINCLDFVSRGAFSVCGIDISEKMLDVAVREHLHDKIRYVNMDMTEISKLSDSFDVVYSSLAFHYIKYLDKLFCDIYSLMNSGGVLLFSMEHPICTASVNGGHFNRNENGEPESYTFSDYAKNGKRITKWFVDGVEKYHRTLGTVITSVASAGFIIDTVDEPFPEPWAVKIRPDIALKETVKPCFLIVKARKETS